MVFLEFTKKGIERIIVLWKNYRIMHSSCPKGRIKLGRKFELLKIAIHFRLVYVQGFSILTFRMVVFKKGMGQFGQRWC